MMPLKWRFVVSSTEMVTVAELPSREVRSPFTVSLATSSSNRKGRPSSSLARRAVKVERETGIRLDRHIDIRLCIAVRHHTSRLTGWRGSGTMRSAAKVNGLRTLLAFSAKLAVPAGEVNVTRNLSG